MLKLKYIYVFKVNSQKARFLRTLLNLNYPN